MRPTPMDDHTLLARSGVQRSDNVIAVSVVMPCLNEAEAIAGCVWAARRGFRRAGVQGEIVVVDNGSTDDSAVVAAAAGARVVSEPIPGYGHALRRGFEVARGRVLIMGDADGTYDFECIDALLARIDAGADMVLGDRLTLLDDPEAMPVLHRIVGTPAITFLLRLFTGARLKDSQSGMRAFRRDGLERLALEAGGMELASEMLYQAAFHGLRIDEVPIVYRRRVGESKLRTLPDGWRHLRYLVLRSPTHVFTAPGALLAVLGLLALSITLLRHDGVAVGPLRWQPVFAGTILLVSGVNALLLGLLAKIYGIRRGLQRPDQLVRLYDERLGFERTLGLGLALIVLGAAIDTALFFRWVTSPGGGTLAVAVLAQTSLLLGSVVAFGSIAIAMVGDTPVASQRRAPADDDEEREGVNDEPLRQAA